VLIVVVFFTTSSDSASFVIDMLASSDVTDHPPTRQRVFWAIAEGAVAATLLAAGGLEALQEIITVLGFPFFILGLIIIYSLVRGVRRETRLEETGSPEPPRRRGRGARPDPRAPEVEATDRASQPRSSS
jgi:choline/glycine/proline betaine transport protein